MVKVINYYYDLTSLTINSISIDVLFLKAKTIYNPLTLIIKFANKLSASKYKIVMIFRVNAAAVHSQ